MTSFATRALIALVIAAAPFATATAAESPEFSPAQVALFNTPHLENLSGPTHLRYELVRKGSQEAGFEDSVEVTVTAVGEDGSKDLAFDFLSGERKRDFAPLEGYRGNPLVMLYLQWDVEVMAQALSGNQHYFRNKIRYALADRAAVEAAEVEFGGRSLPAQRVVFRPFVGDPNADRMGPFERKLYEFTLTPEVPGGIYRIRTLVPGEADGEPIVEDTLTYRGETH